MIKDSVMNRVPLKVALLLGCASGMAAPVAAQRVTAHPAPVRPATTSLPAQVSVPAQSTAAPTVAVDAVAAGPGAIYPQDTDDRYRRSPSYLPDAGGALSGLDYDRKAPPAVSTVPIRTLAEAITLAYRTNPELLATRAQARSADYRIPQARSAYGPTLGASGSYTFTRARQEIIPGLFLGAQGWASTASLILTQPVFTFGRNAAAEAGAYATSEYQRDLLRLTEAQVLNNVVITYVSVLRDASAVTIARENLALLERQLADNRTRYQVRDLTETDLEQTRTRVEFGRAQLLQAQGQLGVSQKQFLQYVGAPPGELAEPDLLDIRFGSLSTAYAYAESNSGLIRAAQAREKISRAAVAAARAESRPRLDLRGTADYGSVSPYSDQLRTTQLIGQAVLTQPIIDSGMRRARVGEAREANEADWRLVDNALRDTRAAIGGAWDQLASLRTSLANYREAIVAAERAYQGALLQQRAGDRSTLDVLDLARDLLTVRTNYNVAVSNEYTARATLLAAAGLLEAPLILPGLVPYDADAHYQRIRRKADIPLLTPALSALDGIANGDTDRDRASRDAGAQQALEQSLPLPPVTALPPVTVP